MWNLYYTMVCLQIAFVSNPSLSHVVPFLLDSHLELGRLNYQHTNCLWKKVTFPVGLTLSKKAVIDPFWPTFAFSNKHCTPIIDPTSFALSIVLVPQHLFTCFNKLLVEVASGVSRKQWILCVLPLQYLALHQKAWAWWLGHPSYTTFGGSKKAYIVEVHSFWRWAGLGWQINICWRLWEIKTMYQAQTHHPIYLSTHISLSPPLNPSTTLACTMVSSHSLE